MTRNPSNKKACLVGECSPQKQLILQSIKLLWWILICLHLMCHKNCFKKICRDYCLRCEIFMDSLALCVWDSVQFSTDVTSTCLLYLAGITHSSHKSVALPLGPGLCSASQYSIHIHVPPGCLNIQISPSRYRYAVWERQVLTLLSLLWQTKEHCMISVYTDRPVIWILAGSLLEIQSVH